MSSSFEEELYPFSPVWEKGPKGCHCEERSVGQASRLSMTGKPAPDPDPGMPVPPAISFRALRLLPPLGSGVAMTFLEKMPTSRD